MGIDCSVNNTVSDIHITHVETNIHFMIGMATEITSYKIKMVWCL